jgi:hypothetical protein
LKAEGACARRGSRTLCLIWRLWRAHHCACRGGSNKLRHIQHLHQRLFLLRVFCCWRAARMTKTVHICQLLSEQVQGLQAAVADAQQHGARLMGERRRLIEHVRRMLGARLAVHRVKTAVPSLSLCSAAFLHRSVQMMRRHGTVLFISGHVPYQKPIHAPPLWRAGRMDKLKATVDVKGSALDALLAAATTTLNEHHSLSASADRLHAEVCAHSAALTNVTAAARAAEAQRADAQRVVGGRVAAAAEQTRLLQASLTARNGELQAEVSASEQRVVRLQAAFVAAEKALQEQLVTANAQVAALHQHFTGAQRDLQDEVRPSSSCSICALFRTPILACTW